MKRKQNIISHDMYAASFFVSMTYIAFIEQTAKWFSFRYSTAIASIASGRGVH
jgi:hypothetical protein